MLKAWGRFSHDGVRDALGSLRRRLRRTGRYRFGSSGDGELTIKGAELTAYARKYRVKDGWRVALCRGSRRIEDEQIDGIETVAAFIKKRVH